MKHISITLLFLFTLTLSVWADDMAAYRLNVENFSKLTVVDGISVEYKSRPDSIGWAVFYTTPDKASQIMFENKAQHLTVRTNADETALKGMPKIRLYSASLSKVENSGDSLLRIIKPAHVDELKVLQIGNGKIEITGIDADYVEAGITTGKGSLKLEGKAPKTKLKNVSTGAIDASKLRVSQANCFIFGTGDIDCRPSEQLRIYGAGSGKVYYYIKPAKITNRGIGVKVLAASEK